MKILLPVLTFLLIFGIKVFISFCPKNDITILDIDKEFEKHYIVFDEKIFKEKDLIVEAAKYWNDIGARFYLPEQLYLTEVHNNYHHLKIIRSDYAFFGILGKYDPLNFGFSGNIILYPKYWLTEHYDPDIIRCIVAHEIGHSFGLLHLRNGDAVMYKHPIHLKKLSKYDILEFYK